jgi:hypothetical protein
MLYRQAITATLAVAALATLVDCGGTSSPAAPSPTITSVGWIEENIDPSFWMSWPAGGQTAFYDFWIHYSGDLSYEEIRSARVYEPNGLYWTINKDATYFDATRKAIGGWGHWYATNTPNLLPIGALRAELTLTSGLVVNSTLTVPVPASTAVGSYTSIFTEDLLIPPLGSAPMIPRATMGSTNTLTVANQTISLAFSVNDSRVFSGFVWLYDASDTYLGGYFYFRDVWTGAIGAPLGGSLHTDGTTNVLTLGPVDLQLHAGVAFGQIAMARIVLTDGAQYLPQVDGRLRYDCRSVGPVVVLTLQ